MQFSFKYNKYIIYRHKPLNKPRCTFYHLRFKIPAYLGTREYLYTYNLHFWPERRRCNLQWRIYELNIKLFQGQSNETLLIYWLESLLFSLKLFLVSCYAQWFENITTKTTATSLSRNNIQVTLENLTHWADLTGTISLAESSPTSVHTVHCPVFLFYVFKR